MHLIFHRGSDEKEYIYSECAEREWMVQIPVKNVWKQFLSHEPNNDQIKNWNEKHHQQDDVDTNRSVDFIGSSPVTAKSVYRH